MRFPIIGPNGLVELCKCHSKCCAVLVVLYRPVSDARKLRGQIYLGKYLGRCTPQDGPAYLLTFTY